MPTVRWCCPSLRLAFRSSVAAQGLTRNLCAVRLPRASSKPCLAFHTSTSPQNRRTTAPSKLCPSCSKPLASSLPACTNCWSIFSLPSDATYHELFGLSYEPNPFAVDLTTLKQRFRQAQAVCHPDTWTSRGQHKQDIAQALSAQVNEAYQALLRPLARAEYILGRNDMPLSERDQVTDMEFIMEIMESRELIDDAEESSEVINLMEENGEKLNETVHEIEKLVGQKDWAGVKAAAIRLRYLEGIARAASKWLDNH